MLESLACEMDSLFPKKAFLTIEDICDFLSCDKKTIYNWTKRSDAKRQPPRFMVGKTLRFPKKDFVRWLLEEQRRGSCAA